ncbi:MAG TPA: hypothetical protein GYA06_01400 [Chloroflexi bacterium]|nr:hypothetical protein [Chloroflexota bacterium]
MNRKYLLLTLVLLLAGLLLLPGVVSAQTPTPGRTYNDDRLVIGDTFRLNNGDTLNGDLTIIGGQVTLSEGSLVNGDVAIMGGVLAADGTIDGDLTALGGAVSLGDNFVLTGQLNQAGSTIDRAPGAVIQGGVRESVEPDDFFFDFGDFEFRNSFEPLRPFRAVTGVLTRFVQTLAMAVLALLVVLILPKPSTRVADTLAAEPAQSAGIGLLTIIVVPFVIVILALLMITIILIPVSLVGILAIAAAFFYGWIIVGYEIGRRLESAINQNWAEPVAAGIGTLILGLATFLLSFVFCLDVVVTTLVAATGVGALILGRFGFPPPSATPPASGWQSPAPAPLTPASPAPPTPEPPAAPDEPQGPPPAY